MCIRDRIDKETQLARFTDRQNTPEKQWKITDEDLSLIHISSLSSAPWYMIDAESRKWTELQVLEYLTQGIDIALSNQALAVPLLQNVFPMTQMPKLSEIPLDKELDDNTYKEELDRLQARLGELHNRLYRKKVPVIIAYEGWDAAGKGGNIKKMCIRDRSAYTFNC